MDLRKSLFGSIVLSGGSTLTKGFGDRLLHEVQRLAVKDMRIKIFAPPERKYTTWAGGSILAGLSTFKKVSRYHYILNKMVNTGRWARGDNVRKLMVARCGLTRMSGRRTQTLFTQNSHNHQSSIKLRFALHSAGSGPCIAHLLPSIS
jgi:hypothetical protein